MSASHPPGPPQGASVTSILDRLQPAQRARHLAALAFRDQAKDRNHLERLTTLAARLESFDPTEALAVLEQAPRETPGIRDSKVMCKAMLAARRYLRGDAEGALADFAAVIAEYPEEASQAHFFRSFFLELRGDID